MNCNICHKPIVLNPSAAERARKDVTGRTAAEYTAIFTTHATCALAQRERETRELIARRNADGRHPITIAGV